MFGATADPGHKCLLAMLRLTGKIPRSIEDHRDAPRGAEQVTATQ